MHRVQTAVISVLLVACAGTDERNRAAEPQASDPAADEPEARVEVPDPAVDEPATEPVDARARAIATAEAFVRAQGYTGVPPTVPADQIVHEGIEGPIESRLNMLEPTAVTASGEGEDWMVIFRYRESRYEGRGRAVRLRAGEGPHLVHQDVVVSAWQ